MLLRLSLSVIGFCSIRSYSEPISNYTGCPGIVYIKPDDNNGNWTRAQERCKQLNSTLPIIDTPERQSCFAKCLQHFNMTPNIVNPTYVWIGANSSWSNQWQWLNESNYSIPAIQMNNTYSRSYAFASKETSSALSISSSVPTEKRFYICRYENPAGKLRNDNSSCMNGSNQTAYVRGSSCFVRYRESLSWFDARNQCLSKDGDLATFSNVSLLSDIIHNGTWWIGLTSTRWTWIYAESGKTNDVTFTQWKGDQPNGNGDAPQCISTDYPYSFEYVSWRDWNCTDRLPFICQIQIHDDISTLESISISRITTTAYADKDNSTRDTRSLVLGVGIGIGIGVPLMLALIALIVFLALRHRKRTASKEPRSGSFPDVTKPSLESPYGVVVMETTASNNSASEYNSTTAPKTPTEYAILHIVSDSPTQNHFGSGDNNAIYSNSSQTPPVAEAAQYAVVNKRTSWV